MFLGESAVFIRGDFTWNTSQPPFLKDIYVDIPAGSLVMIVGSSGSGKTSLTSAILGLMQQVRLFCNQPNNDVYRDPFC